MVGTVSPSIPFRACHRQDLHTATKNRRQTATTTTTTADTLVAALSTQQQQQPPAAPLLSALYQHQKRHPLVDASITCLHNPLRPPADKGKSCATRNFGTTPWSVLYVHSEHIPVFRFYQ